ncbi:MAG: HAD family hydrolase [Clostridiales bacterium]|nr:HAD family hydrolase [Clostridiales bacterium]
MKPDSIILDIDGTLWNSTPIVAEAWNEIVSLRSDVSVHFTAQQLTQLFGRPLNVIADMVFPFLDEADRYALINACCEREHELLRASSQDILYPGVADTIRQLSKTCPLFIVSNCQSGYIELFLEKTGLASCITDFECPGNTGLTKGPNIRLVADRNHLKHPVYVGDIEGDRQASMEAGVPFCHAAYGFGQVDHPDYVIRTFSDLITLF